MPTSEPPPLPSCATHAHKAHLALGVTSDGVLLLCTRTPVGVMQVRDARNVVLAARELKV